MYGYHDVTPNAKDKKRRKQQEYQDALDRDAAKAVAGGQHQGRFPQVNSKYKQRSSKQENAVMNQGGGGGAAFNMDMIMDRLNQFSHYMQANDGRMRELEGNVVALLEGDSQGKMPPGMGADIKDARKLKLRVDELQTILAAEIKSRNISERELEQQIISARENGNQQYDGGGNSNGLAKKVAELSDQLHRTEAALQMETTERIELKKQIDAITSYESTVNSQLKKVQSDIEKEKFLNKVGADERKRQMELIRDTESKIVESKELLAETDHKRIENNKEHRNQLHNMEKKISEQSEAFHHALHEKSAYIDKVAADMQSSQDKAVQDMEKLVKSFEDKVLLVEKNMHATLSESLRSLHTDLRVEREHNEACHQEMKEVLSAEITSRRKAVGKTNANVDKLFTKQEEDIQNLRKLKSDVDEHVKEINASLCKIAAGFSEQLITLQEVTKTAVRTLQIDQVSLTAKLKNAITEYKQLHKLLEDRVDDCDAHVASVESALKAQSKKLTNRMNNIDGKLEEKASELELQIEGESKKREEADRKLAESINTTMENCIARMGDLASDFDSKVNNEATSRSNAIMSAEKRQQDCLAKQGILMDDKMSMMKETVDHELSYAVSIENQTRSRNTEKLRKLLHSQFKTLESTTKESLQAFENSLESRTKSLDEKHLTFADDIRIDFEDRDLCSKQAKRRLERRIARDSKRFTATDDNLRKIISTQEENHKYESEKFKEMLSTGLANCDKELTTEIEDVRKSMVKSSSDVLLEVDRKEVELLRRLKVELMEQLLANHVRSQTHRQQVELGLRNLEVRSCLDQMVNKVVETTVMESIGSKFDAVQSTTSSDTTEAKAYVDMATKFLDKKLMAGFDDYNKRLARGLDDVRKDVQAVSDGVLGQVEKNDVALLDHLKKIHSKSNHHRQRLEEGLVNVEVSSCMDRVINTIVENDSSARRRQSNFNAANDRANWDTLVDEKTGGNYYYNRVTDVTQWDQPTCLKTDTSSLANLDNAAERENITAEIDLKINAVGIEVLDRVQKVQLRQKESDDLLKSYDLPVLLDSVSSLRRDVADTAEKLQTVKEELDQMSQQGKALANAVT